MTNKNKPNVNIVAGKDSIIKIGFTNILSNPSTAATITAATKLSTSTFDINLDISITNPAVIKILINNFIRCYLLFLIVLPIARKQLHRLFTNTRFALY